jgi:hypothetical protein
MIAGILLALIGLISLLGMVGALFLSIWYGKASQNLYALGARRIQWSWPIFMVGGVCLVIGLLGSLAHIGFILAYFLGSIVLISSLQEVWKGSNPSYLVNGAEWRRSGSSKLILAWGITGILFPVFVVAAFLPNTIGGSIGIEWYLFNMFMLASHIVLAFLMVIRINLRQRAKYLAWARHSVPRQ